MATGSGKTVIMAGLILYLYEKGYRKFIMGLEFYDNDNENSFKDELTQAMEKSHSI